MSKQHGCMMQVRECECHGEHGGIGTIWVKGKAPTLPVLPPPPFQWSLSLSGGGRSVRKLHGAQLYTQISSLLQTTLLPW